MKLIILTSLLVLLGVGPSFANITRTELLVGDILLQPLHCHACNLIEAQTKSPYSHIGVIIDKRDGVYIVAEAFGAVRAISMSEFLSKTQKSLEVEVLRPHYVSSELAYNYYKLFDGLPYDSKFLWGDDEIYCSELVQKLFSVSNMLSPKPIPMLYDINPELWDRFFRGDTPSGKLGVSPVAFKNSNLYIEMGFYSE